MWTAHSKIILNWSHQYKISDMIIFQTPLTLTAEYVMNGADLMLPGVATLSGMAEKYTFNIHNDNDNL